MSNEVVLKYQLAGLDERERGFSRLINVERADGGLRAVLRYEDTMVETEACETSDAALNCLVQLLHARGFAQLKSRLDFRGVTYLGSQELWTEYPDPDRPLGHERSPIAEQSARRTGWIGKVLKLFAS